MTTNQEGQTVEHLTADEHTELFSYITRGIQDCIRLQNFLNPLWEHVNDKTDQAWRASSATSGELMQLQYDLMFSTSVLYGGKA